MAKKEKNGSKAEDKATAKKPAEEKPVKEKAPEFKYGVSDIATKLGIKETSVRVKLRNHEVPKAGRSYGWNSKEELQKVIDAISAKASTPKKGDDAGDDEDDED